MVSGFLVAVTFATALWAIDALPAGARVAVHWNLRGEPDAWMGKWAALLSIPVLAALLRFLLWAFPQGIAAPGKIVLPAHAQRTLICCVLLLQATAEMAISLNALGRW